MVFLAFEFATDFCNKGIKCARDAGNSEGNVQIPREKIPVITWLLRNTSGLYDSVGGGGAKKLAQRRKSPLANRRDEHRE